MTALDWRRVGAWAGLIGPALFVATFTIEGWLRPGYDARSMFVSELALGPRGWVQIANFMVFGPLVVVLARGLAAGLKDGAAARAGPVLLAIVGVALFASGPCVMDPVSTPREQMSASGLAHALFGALVFSLAPASCFVLFRRFRRDRRWRPLAAWTLAVAVITTAAVVLMRIGPTRAPAAPNAFNPWDGALQRTVLIPYCMWLYTVALRLRSQE